MECFCSAGAMNRDRRPSGGGRSGRWRAATALAAAAVLAATARGSDDQLPTLVMLVAEDEYQTGRTLPEFVARTGLEEEFRVLVMQPPEEPPRAFADLRPLSRADLLLISVRRLPLPPEQLEVVRRFVRSGKPVLGIRTASHAFAAPPRGPPEAPAGREWWPEFDAEVFGGNYAGHFQNELRPRVDVGAPAADQARPLLEGCDFAGFRGGGSLYRTAPVAAAAEVLLEGRIDGERPQPVAWTFVRRDGGKSFYTSLGHPDDFARPAFRQLLLNAIRWAAEPPGSLPGTERLTMEGDPASEMIAGIDRFLLRELDRAAADREERWQRDFSSPAAYEDSVREHRERLRSILGVRDPLVADPVPRLESTVRRGSLVGRGPGYEIHEVSWPAFGDVRGTGLLLVPDAAAAGGPAVNVIAIPDCEVLPEQLVGLAEGVRPAAQYARRLAEGGCRVLVPLLIDRAERLPGLGNREWLYRPAFELGRGLTAYELQKILAAVDWMRTEAGDGGRIGVFGWGEGGLLALYAAALEPAIDVVAVSGSFDSRQDLWQEPIDRNVFGLLTEFGTAELAGLVLPRHVVVDACRGPERTWAGGRGAPARLVSPPPERVGAEFARLRAWAERLGSADRVELLAADDEAAALASFWRRLTGTAREFTAAGDPPRATAPGTDPGLRLAAQIAELDRHNRRLLGESYDRRRERTLARLDVSSLPAYETSTAILRREFRDRVIGWFDRPLSPPRPRTRPFRETAAWTAHEVVLDVFPDVIASGLLLVPKGIEPGERRPVVVCQHGLEGRPQDTIGEQAAATYAAFAGRLAERGFVTFAPQNPYIFGDRFRTLQRKANPIGKTLFSVIAAQHQQIVRWLQGLEFVAPERIGFYGLSYGGKTALRVPAIVTDYCLSICSGDFNEWIDKTASTGNPRSYVDTIEYEIFEFDLGSTFSHAEMAALIAPRPFMVERGHFDRVADDWMVAHEYAKVRFLYAAQLDLPDATEIEWFAGPHAIHGVKTFEFLHRHLKWPPPPGHGQ